MRSAVRDLTLTLTRDDASDQVRWWVDAGNSLWISGDTATGDGEPRIVLCLDGSADRVSLRQKEEGLQIPQKEVQNGKRKRRRGRVAAADRRGYFELWGCSVAQGTLDKGRLQAQASQVPGATPKMGHGPDLRPREQGRSEMTEG